MLATYVPPKVTRYTLADMAYALRTGLKFVLGTDPSDECLAVAMAKCRLETGNGEHVWNDNLGNVKCPPTASGNFTCIVLNEVIDNVLRWFAPQGELVGGRGSALKGAPLAVPDGHPQTRMQSRANRADAGIFYVEFIFKRPQYARARDAMLAGNPEAYSRELKAAGYYTAPVEQYTKTVVALYNPSLAFLRGQVGAMQPEQPEKSEWHNQMLLDGFVRSEYERLLQDPSLHGARALREYEEAGLVDDDTNGGGTSNT